MVIQSNRGFRVTASPISDVDGGEHTGHAVSLHDQHLVLAAQSGCQKAFRELWELYSRRVYRTLLRITNNPHDAEDALQDAFFRAFLALDTFEGRANFYTWLTRIAINSALGMLRRRRARPESSLVLSPQDDDDRLLEEFRDLSPNPEQMYGEREEHERLMQAIHKLPPMLRKITQARIAGGCSIKEVASRFNISEAPAKARLYRARIMLSSTIASNGRSKAA